MAYAILQERGVSASINRQPYFPSAHCLVVVAPSYSAPMLHPSSFLMHALRLCFFLGYVMMDWLLMELATDIIGHVAK